MNAILTETMQWAAEPGPPNAVFVAVLLTAPYLWSNKVRSFVRERFGGSGDG